jgi:hypothetical protein
MRKVLRCGCDVWRRSNLKTKSKKILRQKEMFKTKNEMFKTKNEMIKTKNEICLHFFENATRQVPRNRSKCEETKSQSR